MIVRRETYLVILIITVSSFADLQCPLNRACDCHSSYEGALEMNCFTGNDSSFLVNFQPNQYIEIDCINSPKWADFYFDVPLVKNEIKSIFFRMCDLPNNGSLAKITQILGITGIEKLTFQSYKNLSSALKNQHLKGFENLKSLILSSNNVSYIDKDLFANMTNLTGLNLRDNNLHLVSGIFNYTPHLQWLELADNNLKSIELGTFGNLKNLTLLNLWKNDLTELHLGIFEGLVALKTLDLNRNNMTGLPEDIFAKLKNLEVLNLSLNNFTDLPKNLLRNNTKLRTFSLFENKRNMTTLPNGFFANLTELKVLNLKKDGFIVLPEDLFWGCSSLTNITLSRNYLKSLPARIFRDTKELKELLLTFNDLEELPDNIFSNTNRLIKLDLSINHITFISNHVFDGLYELKELNMEKNQLMTISDQSFTSLGQLKIAKFSNNRLTLQSTFLEYRDEFGTESPFHYCIELKELYLANNSISEIFSDWKLSDVHLKMLDLRYNNISSITSEDLQFLSSDIKVDLTYNKIEHIDLHSAEQLAQFQQISHDAIILVENNPICCDCELYDFLRYIEGRMHPNVQNYFHIKPGNLTCQNPEELKDVPVTQLKSESLMCSVNDSKLDTKCPTACKCLVKPEGKIFIFDCSHRNLTSVPSDLKNPDGSWQLELNFANNQFIRMPDLKNLNRTSIKQLNLSHNKISEIFLDELPRSLEVLELHNNNMSTIDHDVMEFWKNSSSLVNLTLHENPWTCDCDTNDFLNFIQTELVTIPSLLKVKCLGKSKTVSEMTTIEFCPFDKAAVIGLSVAIALIGLLIGTSGLLYYKYQQQIKVWLFAHQWCMWFVTEEELDKDKQYDAFISYSHRDQDFVVNELVSKLENGATPFKLCLHYRDWLAGEWIPANIARSVEDSKRTIVVLSLNFLESVWGRMEFRAAHRQALSENRARVILILYGDIGSTEDLDPELKAYISMNTYIKWGDPWFWDKLRYALPHRTKLPRKSNTMTGRKIFENHQLYIQANGDKKELMYPIGNPETPPNTTPPADTFKTFVCDKKTDQLPSKEFLQESYKLNGTIILIPEHLNKHEPTINNECVI